MTYVNTSAPLPYNFGIFGYYPPLIMPLPLQGVMGLSFRVIAYRRVFIREAPEGCSLHRHRSSAKR